MSWYVTVGEGRWTAPGRENFQVSMTWTLRQPFDGWRPAYNYAHYWKVRESGPNTRRCGIWHSCGCIIASVNAGDERGCYCECADRNRTGCDHRLPEKTATVLRRWAREESSF